MSINLNLRPSTEDIMHRTKLFLAFAALAACAPQPPAATAPALAAQDTARITTLFRNLRPPLEIVGRPAVRWSLEERMAFHKVPGISVALIENGRIAWAGGVGVLEAGRPDPVTPATLFQAASISKPVAATAMLRLVERGALDLDADVNGYLTSWQVPRNRFTEAQKVTLRRIVSHNAGLTVHGFGGYAQGAAVPTTVQVLNGAAPANSRPVVADTLPGAIGRYSGGGFVVMQQLLEDVTHRPFANLMQREVLTPAGMRSSSYQQPLPAPRHAQAARGHRPSGEVIAGGWHVYPEQAPAGLWTTPTDLATWLIALSDAYAGRSTSLLSREMAMQMLTVQKDGFGLGMQLSGSGDTFGFGHNGSNEGYRAFAYLFPGTGSGLVVMTNGDNGGSLAQELIRAVAAEYGWPRFQADNLTPAALDSASLAGLVGTYTLGDPSRTAEVRMEGGKLVLHGPPGTVQELVAVNPTRFVTAQTYWRVDFTRDAAGRGTSIKVFRTGGPPLEGPRAP